MLYLQSSMQTVQTPYKSNINFNSYQYWLTSISNKLST